jgi:hypothetical protein
MRATSRRAGLGALFARFGLSDENPLGRGQLPVVAHTTNTVRRRAGTNAWSGNWRVSPTAFALALLLGCAAWVARSAPSTCADVLKSTEKHLADAGIQHPPLKIVPKNLSTGYRVVGTCEGGTQRIVHDLVAASSPSHGKTAVQPRSAASQP